uniref:5'-3' exonuclease domain-containing protein n=1 Tax=Salix viminalis TaxID=40686 RepID=A0A6N2KQT9_SALVM
MFHHLIIAGVEGIGVVHAVELISRFGTLENLLKCVDQVEGESIRKTLKENANQAVLSKELSTWFHLLPQI